jgi:hypothetical protein
VGDLYRPTGFEKVNEDVPWWDYFDLFTCKCGMVEVVDKTCGHRKVWATFDDAKRSAIEQTKLRIPREIMES